MIKIDKKVRCHPKILTTAWNEIEEFLFFWGVYRIQCLEHFPTSKPSHGFCGFPPFSDPHIWSRIS